MLAEEAEASEAGRDREDLHYVRNRYKAKDPSQVYSVRVPVGRLEQLRKMAAEQEIAPSTLMRQWVLERLAVELEDAAVARARARPMATDEHVSTSPTTVDASEGQHQITVDERMLYRMLMDLARQVANDIRDEVKAR
jgi:hypothetical protein